MGFDTTAGVETGGAPPPVYIYTLYQKLAYFMYALFTLNIDLLMYKLEPKQMVKIA